MKQIIRDKIGSGIPGVITAAEIFDAVGVYEVGFYFNVDTKKWTQSNDIPAATKDTIAYPDVVVDLEHNVNLDREDCYFGENYTITEHIEGKMDEYETEVEILKGENN